MLRLGLLPLAAGGFWRCSGLDVRDQKINSQVNEEVHWARREQWTGEEMVFGVAVIQDRYLLVHHDNYLGWAFPGGTVHAGPHGQKLPNNFDLLNAVVDYSHTQAMLSFEISETALFAYGYGIDPIREKTVMVHWFELGLSPAALPNVYPNLEDIIDARWVAADSTRYGGCLEKKRAEYLEAQEGKTFVMERCRV